MKVHKEGFGILSFLFILLFAINLGVWFIAKPGSAALNWSALISVLLFFAVLSFFRSPKRTGFMHASAVVAPADGKIVAIEEVEENEVLKTRCIQVSVFMSVFNVHINWYPVSGMVRYCQHHSGRFLAAYLPKSSSENERTTVAIDTQSGQTIVARQIAGAIARRIICYPGEGEIVDQGTQMGFIRFGSRVDVFLPLGTRIDVKMGQQVKGRQTILGWLES